MNEHLALAAASLVARRVPDDDAGFGTSNVVAVPISRFKSHYVPVLRAARLGQPGVISQGGVRFVVMREADAVALARPTAATAHRTVAQCLAGLKSPGPAPRVRPVAQGARSARAVKMPTDSALRTD